MVEENKKKRGGKNNKAEPGNSQIISPPAQGFLLWHIKFLGLVLQHCPDTFGGRCWGGECHKHTGKCTQVCKGGCAHKLTCAHTEASCFDTLTFLTAAQLQEKKKFQLMYKSEESEHPPGFIHRTLSLCLQYKSKCFISREFLYLKVSF